MKVGIPNSLLYYRYGALWKSFFKQLGVETLVSGPTTGDVLAKGVGASVDESCLPVKAFLGHVQSLMGQCDAILVPRFERMGKNEEYCIRFWGLPDVVRNTFPQAALLEYNHQGHKMENELAGFLGMGKELGIGRIAAMNAYHWARVAQQTADRDLRLRQDRLLKDDGVKVLLVAQPYLIHDPYLGGPLLRLLREQGAMPVFADRCDRGACHAHARALSHDLYWTMNKEAIGAIPFLRDRVDGVVLLSAFPCGTDSLVNELVLRRLDGMPAVHIVMDEQQGEAGLQTRVECFVDILKERRRANAS